MAQLLYALVEHTVVGYILGYSFSKAVTEIVGLMEAHCRDALFQYVDDS